MKLKPMAFLRRGALILIVVSAAGCETLQKFIGLSAERSIDFRQDKLGRTPANFTTDLTGGGGAVVWIVRSDSSPGGSGKMLVQESSDDTSYRFPLCIFDRYQATDESVDVQFKALSGTVDQAGGIVLRYMPENYYVARANALEDNIDLFKTVNGKRSKIAEVPAKVEPGQWHTLRFAAQGTHLIVSFDGHVVIETDDATFATPGKVGLWTKADSVSAFRNFRIEAKP